MQPSSIAVVGAVVLLFLTSGFIYIYAILILIHRCLLNVMFSMTIALNGQNSPPAKFLDHSYNKNYRL